MTLDIEHFAKIELLKKLENDGCDGYQIIQEFLLATGGINEDNWVIKEINRCRDSAYTGDLTLRYPDYDFPVWVFLELINFGTFITFYEYYKTGSLSGPHSREFYLLKSVKSIRNACAHNRCIINNLTKGTSPYKPPYDVVRAIRKLPGVTFSMNQSRMSNVVLQHIVTTLYLYNKIASDGVKKHRAQSLNSLVDRMFKHPEFYVNSQQISSSFTFLKLVIEGWFPMDNRNI